MKKLFVTSLFVLAAVASGKAQEISKNALGLRFGGSNGVGAEVSYQRALGGNNRLEADLGWRTDDDFDMFKLTGLYQWVWNIENGFNWYAGVGGGVGSVDDGRHYPDDYDYDDGAFLYLAGDIGIEYNFDIPLMIALDFRPELGFSDYDVYDDFSPDFALSLRYQF